MKIKNYKELAKIAGCGIGTISRYFSGGSISDEMRQRIEAILAQNKYTIKKDKINFQVCLVFPTNLDGWLLTIINALIQKLQENNYQITIKILNFETEDWESSFIVGQEIRIVLFVNADSLLQTDIFQKLSTFGDLTIYGQNVVGYKSVYLETEKMLYHLTLALLARHKKILYLSNSVANNKEYYRGYFKACSETKVNVKVMKIENEPLVVVKNKLMNYIIDEHIDLVICEGVDSTFVAKELKHLNLEIISIIDNLKATFMTALFPTTIQIDVAKVINAIFVLLTTKESEQKGIEALYNLEF